MKKVLLSFFAIALSFGAFAQDSAMHNKNAMHNNMQHNMKSHEGIVMRNGKVMVIENGKSTPLTQDKTLSNGEVISSNGQVKMSDGTTSMLKDGDWVNMNGTISHHDAKMKEKWNKDKMKNSADSLK
ncbi:MAG TPA: DUF6799 domain-containing protein [Hanamia sp.]|nr:DUF6799 domain-containing protein [Hanamia sp.]